MSQAGEEWRDLEREKRLLACEEALVLRDEAFEKTSSQIERGIKAGAWALVLCDVPGNAIVALMVEVLKNRRSEFPPRPMDLLDVWQGVEWAGGAKVVRANASAYEPFQPTHAQPAHAQRAQRAAQSGYALPQSDTGGRAAFEAMGVKMRAHSRPRPGAAREVPVPRDDCMLGAALMQQAGFECWLVQREIWTAFGWWLLAQFPVTTWTYALVNEQWQIWQRQIWQCQIWQTEQPAEHQKTVAFKSSPQNENRTTSAIPS